MSTDGKQVQEAEVAKLREWVDDLRVSQPLEAPKAPAVHDPKPTQHVLKAPSELTEGAKRIQKIVESMDLRQQERARLVGSLNSRMVEVERMDTESWSNLSAESARLRAETDEKIRNLESRARMERDLRQGDLTTRVAAIDKIDLAMANFRKQLDAELGKLDPQRGEAK